MKSRTTFCFALLAVGFLLAWLPLVLSPFTFPAWDEVFQVMESAHRLVFGYGMVSWEFDYGARSWALGAVAALPLGVARHLGQGPEFYVPLIWATFSLGAAGVILCVGLWAERFYGRLGGLAAAIAAASWIDNLYFGGRALSEVVSVHLLIGSVWLAEPGYRVENRARLMTAGFLAAIACVLRLQLGPAALLLWLWPWRDQRRLLLLSAGAVIALVLDGAFDLLAWSYPFEPLWRNAAFNLWLGGGDAFGTAPVWGYFPELWFRWGVSLVPFLGLAALGARRLPLLAAMSLLTFAVHAVIPHKEYRFLLPAIMMASVLWGLGLVEATGWLAGLLRARMGERARLLAASLMGLLWLGLSGGNVLTPNSDPRWSADTTSVLETTLAISRLPAICGVGYANMFPWYSGGYTFLHRPVPMYFSVQQDNFFQSQKAYDVLVLRREDMDYYRATPLLDGYTLLQCYRDHCVWRRQGGCSDIRTSPPRLGELNAELSHDPRYPYAEGIPRK